MLLKEADSKDHVVSELEKLIASSSGDRRNQAESELRKIRAGIKGERDAAYYIDFDYKDHKHVVVLHDLRLEINGRVAQIDHLLINALLDCFVLETKHFSGGLKITEEGEFLRWSNYKKNFEGMASPLAQNERHIAVLRDAFEQIELPKRLGIRLKPTCHSYILVSPEARVDRPKNFDSSKVIKADALKQTINAFIDNKSALEVLKFTSLETLENIGHQLMALHKPAPQELSGRFANAPGASGPLPPAGSGPLPAKPSGPSSKDFALPKCKACNSELLSIQYGQYGYYFKCSECQGNTPAKVACGQPGHKERLRKDGRTFYRECADCGSSSVYYVNPA